MSTSTGRKRARLSFKRAFRSGQVESGFAVLSGRIALLLTGSATAILLPVIADHQTVGHFFVAQTLIAGGAILCQLGLMVSIQLLIAERLAGNDPAGARHAANLGLHLVILAGFSVVALVSIMVALLGMLDPKSTMWPYDLIAIVVAASMMFAALLSVIGEMHRAREAFVYASFLPMGASIVIVLLGLTAWLNGQHTSLLMLLLAGLAGLIAFTAVGGLAFVFAARRWGGKPKTASGYGAILSSSWPNLVTAIVLFTVTQSDLWIVALLGSSLELANYGVALRLAALILLPLATVNGLISPLIVKFWARGKKRVLQRMLTGTMAGATAIACSGYICFLLGGSQTIVIVWGESYRLVYELVAILGIGSVIHTAGGSAGQLLLLLGHQRLVMRVVLIVGAATIVLGLAAMELIGIHGLALVYSIGISAQTVIFSSYAGRVIGVYPAMAQLYRSAPKREERIATRSPALPSDDAPLVSIVIPTFNCAAYLGEAIRSVRAQTYPMIELIVVDDGSTDDTPSIVEQFGSHLRYIRQANAGQSAALNVGWEASRGEILGFLSADDRLRPDAIAHAVALIRRRPEIVAVYPDFGLIDAQSRPLRLVQAAEYDEKRLIAGVDCLPGPGALFRREAWNVAGGWDTTLRQVPDLDFYLRLAMVGPFARLPHLLADFRIHDGSATYGRISQDRAAEPVSVIDRFFSRPDLPPHVAAWRSLAHANASMLCGLMHARSGRYRKALRCFRLAVVAHPNFIASRRVRSLAVILLQAPLKHAKWRRNHD